LVCSACHIHPTVDADVSTLTRRYSAATDLTKALLGVISISAPNPRSLHITYDLSAIRAGCNHTQSGEATLAMDFESDGRKLVDAKVSDPLGFTSTYTDRIV